MPLPTTLAGAVRSQIARMRGAFTYDKTLAEELMGVAVHGPLLCIDEEPYFAAPSDAATVKVGSNDRIAPSRPSSGADPGVLLDGNIEPCILGTNEEVRPNKSKPGQYWSLEDTVAWLTHKANETLPFPKRSASAILEERTHVEISPSTRSAREGQLFRTQGSCFGWLNVGQWQRREMAVRVGDAGLPDSQVMTLGGERRLSVWRETSPNLFACPEGIRRSLAGAKRIRMQLATAGAFSAGWLPALSRVDGVSVKLVGACVGRRVAMSGWNPFGGISSSGEPKPLRWLAPAGSVYFYEVESGAADALADQWLQPMSDTAADCRDGLGLSLWGVW